MGLLGFQGDVSEHKTALLKASKNRGMNITIREIRKDSDMNNISGLIIPGGESTTIYNLINSYGLYARIKNEGMNGLPIWGTCAGLIIISKNTGDDRVIGMDLLDVEVERNAYGRQINSFISELDISRIGKFEGVFIRAPVISHVGDVEVMAYHNEKPVMVRHMNYIGTTFHPELTDDTRIHELFLDLVEREGYTSTGNNKGDN